MNCQGHVPHRSMMMRLSQARGNDILRSHWADISGVQSKALDETSGSEEPRHSPNKISSIDHLIQQEQYRSPGPTQPPGMTAPAPPKHSRPVSRAQVNRLALPHIIHDLLNVPRLVLVARRIVRWDAVIVFEWDTLL